MAIAGGLAYVVTQNALKVVDVSNPTSPYTRGSYDGYWQNNLAISGNLLYMASCSLDIVDVSDVDSAPVLRGTFEGNGYCWYDIMVSGSLAYLTGDSLDIIDVSNPAQPVLRGSYRLANWADSLSLSHGLAYVTYRDGFQIIDVANPTLPVLRGSFDAQLSDAYRVSISDGLAYVWNPGNEGSQERFNIYDVSNPRLPVLRGAFELPPVDTRDFAVSGGLIYMADGEGGLNVLRYTGPLGPTPTPASLPTGLPPTRPGGMPVLHAKLDSPSVDPEGGAVTYRYLWTSSGANDPPQIIHAKADIEDTLENGQEGATLNAGETWTITVIPYDLGGQPGPSFIGRFTIEANGDVRFSGWGLR